MVYISLLIHLWSYLDTLMPIGQAIPQIVALPQVIVFSWELLLSLDVAKSRLLLPALALNLNIVLLLMPVLNYAGYDGC